MGQLGGIEPPSEAPQASILAEVPNKYILASLYDSRHK